MLYLVKGVSRERPLGDPSITMPIVASSDVGYRNCRGDSFPASGRIPTCSYRAILGVLCCRGYMSQVPHDRRSKWIHTCHATHNSAPNCQRWWSIHLSLHANRLSARHGGLLRDQCRKMLQRITSRHIMQLSTRRIHALDHPTRFSSYVAHTFALRCRAPRLE